MNNKTPLQQNEIEQRLQKTVPVVLSVQEKVDLKASLMTYTQYHAKSEASSKAYWAHFSWYHMSGAIAVFLLFIGTTGAWSHQSLPGETLYQLKLSVIEPTLLAVQYPELDTTSIQIEKMERRLEEVKLLQKEGPLTEEAREDVMESLIQYADDLSNETDQPTTRSLQAYDTAIALMNAQDKLFAGSAPQTSTSSFGMLTDDLEEEQSDQIDLLLATNASDTVAKYIQDSVNDIKTKISSQEYDADTVEILGDSINKVSNSLSTNSIEDAQEYIADMNQLILTEEYLDVEVEQEG